MEDAIATTTTTKKFDAFLSCPLQDGELTSVPGVGPKTHSKLKEACIDTVEQLMGQFLLLGRDTDRMSQWLKETCDVRPRDAATISEGLQKKGAKIVLL
jgi:hypothetical protein